MSIKPALVRIPDRRAGPGLKGYLSGLALAATLATFGNPAHAAGGGYPCEADAFRFCAYAIPDKGRIEACLKQNMQRLNPACQARFHWHRGHTRAKRRYSTHS